MKVADILIFENDDFLVVNKPAGLLSIADREGKEISLKKILKDEYGEIFTVHRLDKDTSGLIVFAKNEALHKILSYQFEQRQTKKIYLGLIMGSPLKEKDTIDSPIMEHPTKKGVMIVHRKGKEAVTDYEVQNTFKIYSWVRFQIHTGRTHQIRVHMKHIGNPIVCDKIYGDGNPVFLSSIKHNYKLSRNEEEEKPILNRLALHANQLTFTSSDDNTYQFEAPIPKDLKATLQQLEKRNKKFTS
jgi:23S rRNA pseudouridine955/2504/2580 synthase/23S rRNA pseudouridine1911/1915/1917 synthase